MSLEFDSGRDVPQFYEPGHGYEEVPDSSSRSTNNFTSNSQDMTDDEMAGIDFGIVLAPNETIGYTENYTEERNWVVVGVLIALIVVLWIILGVMLCVPLIRCIKRRMPVSKKRINRRYETIEGWLITKTVKSHDDGCEKLQNKFSPKSAGDIESQEELARMKHTESYDTADTTTMIADETFFMNQDERECPICMEYFVVGDVVSWSSYETCSHTYHHQCIKEWLLRHNNCPFCREIFLPVDNVHTKITMKMFKELSDLRAQRAEKTYYCIQDGLVTLEEKSSSGVSSTTSGTAAGPSSLLRKCGHIRSGEFLQLKERLKAGVTKADLRKLRGNRCEKVCYEGAPLPDIIEDREVPSAEASATESPSNPLAVPLGSADHDVTSSIPPRLEGELLADGDSSTDSSNDQDLSVGWESSSVSSAEEAEEMKDVNEQETEDLAEAGSTSTDSSPGSNDYELGTNSDEHAIREVDEPCDAPISTDTQLRAPDDGLSCVDELSTSPEVAPITNPTIVTVIDDCTPTPEPAEESHGDPDEEYLPETQVTEGASSLPTSCESSVCGEPEQSCTETLQTVDSPAGIIEELKESPRHVEAWENISEAGVGDQLSLDLSIISVRSEMEEERVVVEDHADDCDGSDEAARTQPIPHRMASF